MLPHVRNGHLILKLFVVRGVEGVGRSRGCSSVGMTLLVADTDSTTLTRSVLSLLQHLEQIRACLWTQEK